MSKENSEANTLRQNIQKLQEAVELLKKNGLRERAIIVLLHDLTGVGKRDIKAIIDGAAELQETYFQ